MSTQKKIIISLSALCLAMVVAFIAVIAVLAASNQSVKSQIGVTYTAKDVNVIVGGDYAFKDEAQFTSIGDSIEFHTSDEQQTKQLSLDNIRLSDEKPFVVLRYSFENLSRDNNVGIKTTVNQETGTENVRVTVGYSKDIITPHLYNTVIGKSIGDAVLGGREKAYVYVRIAIISLSDSAAFVGDISFDLTLSTSEATADEGMLKFGTVTTYGEYPQTHVGSTLNTTLVEEYNKIGTEEESALKPTGKVYHTDIKGTMTECPEFTYEPDGQKYVLIEEARFNDSISDSTAFSTGERCSSYSGKPVFFKVEPIQFRLMDYDGDNTLTIFSEYVLGSMRFGSNNTWKGSTLEAFLNDQFLKDSELEYNYGTEPRKPFALETTLQNNVTNNYTDGSGPESTDKIWLPSLNDLRTWYEEDGIKYNTTFSYLARKATDFAMASYTYTSSYNSSYNGFYWLRSAGTSSSDVCYVNYYGVVAAAPYYTGADHGFCPALKINFE